MHKIKLASLLALSITLVGALCVPSKANTACRATTIAGTYGFRGNGFGGGDGNDAERVPAFFPSAATGEISFTATSHTGGTLSGSESLSFGGLQFSLTFTGTYTVNAPTCAGSITATFQNGGSPTLDFVIVKGGEDIYFHQTNPGAVFHGVMTKESNKESNDD